MSSTLTEKQLTFVREYLVDLNATRAAIRAGYGQKNAARQGSRLCRTPRVWDRIQAAMRQRETRTEISQDRILLELSRIAFADLRDILTWDGGSLSLKESGQISADSAACIAEVSETARGTLRIKRHDRLKALELLMRHTGMLQPGRGSEPLAEPPGSAACERQARSARQRLLALRAEREAQTGSADDPPADAGGQ